MRSRRIVVLPLLGVIAAACFAASATADRTVVPGSSRPPWDGGAAAVTPLEQVVTRIASRIAGHAVSVRCETAAAFRSLAGSNETAGFVNTVVDHRTGTFAATATVIELTSRVCGSLQRFAQAAEKPTRCMDSATELLVPCFAGTPVSKGSGIEAVCWTSGCYRVIAYQPGYWASYARYAFAILTLAHEAIHTMQAVAGARRPTDDRVETQAECYGMQWMPWVAGQLGASPVDAQSIANYYWLGLYPAEASRHSTKPYWSAQCRPKGVLDIRAAGATAWP